MDLNVLSLGAGVQSTTILLMSHEGYLPKLDAAIFADTGWEPQDIYSHLDELEKTVSIPIHRVSYGNIREDVLRALNKGGVGNIGQPPFYVRNASNDGTANEDEGGKLWRKCTADYKVGPIQKKVRELLGYKKREVIKKKARQWIGISIDEAHRMKDSRQSWIDNWYPLVDKMMSRDDCLRWLKAHGYKVPRKSSCIGCPYHSKGYWVRMKKYLPDEWKDAVEFDNELRKGKLPGVTGDAFLHRRMLPLEQAVALDHDEDQMDFFGNECEGMCGV